MKSKTQRQEEANTRQSAYNALPLETKIANCRNRRGKSHRELSRLLVAKNAMEFLKNPY